LAHQRLPPAGSAPDAIATYCLPFTSNVMGGAKKACYWSFFEAKLQPVRTIESGDEITIDTISCGPKVVPDGRCQATF
jgi:hypothetical protein